jgi:hypothetical protein
MVERYGGQMSTLILVLDKSMVERYGGQMSTLILVLDKSMVLGRTAVRGSAYSCSTIRLTSRTFSL